jgi:hypothetical protein
VERFFRGIQVDPQSIGGGYIRTITAQDRLGIPQAENGRQYEYCWML